MIFTRKSFHFSTSINRGRNFSLWHWQLHHTPLHSHFFPNFKQRDRHSWSAKTWEAQLLRRSRESHFSRLTKWGIFSFLIGILLVNCIWFFLLEILFHMRVRNYWVVFEIAHVVFFVEKASFYVAFVFWFLNVVGCVAYYCIKFLACGVEFCGYGVGSGFLKNNGQEIRKLIL